MIQLKLDGCERFVTPSAFKASLGKALEAYDVLDSETGPGNDFLGWKTLPDGIPASLLQEYESVRDDWYGLGVNLVIVIGIGQLILQLDRLYSLIVGHGGKDSTDRTNRVAFVQASRKQMRNGLNDRLRRINCQGIRRR